MEGEDKRAPWSPPIQPNKNAQSNNEQNQNAPPNTLQTVNQNQELPQLSIGDLNNIINALQALRRQLYEQKNSTQ